MFSVETRRWRACPIDFTNPSAKSGHDRMVQLVEQMLTLHKQLPAAKTGHDQTHLQRQIDATDRQIDRLVYELYGLTEEEIAVLVPFDRYEGKEVRTLGLLSGKASFSIPADFKLSNDELLSL